jgi:DNA-binding transcriptional ArsR family regulator
VDSRSLITPLQANGLAELFKTFASDTRLRLLHALVCAKELCVTDLADRIGMKAQAVSNQLHWLADRGVLTARRDGKCIYYRVDDPCVADLLDKGLCLMEDSVARRKKK